MFRSSAPSSLACRSAEAAAVVACLSCRSANTAVDVRLGAAANVDVDVDVNVDAGGKGIVVATSGVSGAIELPPDSTSVSARFWAVVSSPALNP